MTVTVAVVPGGLVGAGVCDLGLAGRIAPYHADAAIGSGFLIADSNSGVVRRVAAGGIISRVAGTGTTGGSGDDGPATLAQLGSPAAVAVTADGAFLIADSMAHVARKMSPSLP